VFKNLVTGGIMTARKLYKDTISIQNKTKIIMTCNRLPTNFDSSYGAKRRLLIIELKNRYCRENGNLDTKLKYKLRQELAGIWNRGYEAFLEMKNRGGFIDVESVRRTVDEFSIADNPVANWIIDNEEYELGGGVVSTADAYSSFNMWAAQNGYARRYIPTKTKFSRDLRHLYGVTNKTTRIDGKVVRAYYGLKIKESEDEVQTQAV
jgi:phage/plasmid-associated DNA primase